MDEIQLRENLRAVFSFEMYALALSRKVFWIICESREISKWISDPGLDAHLRKIEKFGEIIMQFIQTLRKESLSDFNHRICESANVKSCEDERNGLFAISFAMPMHSREFFGIPLRLREYGSKRKSHSGRTLCSWEARNRSEVLFRWKKFESCVRRLCYVRCNKKTSINCPIEGVVTARNNLKTAIRTLV